MGTYTDATELRKLYKDIDTTGLVDNDIEFFIRTAENEISAKLAMRYALPFSSTPPVIKSIAQEKSFIKILDRFFTAETRSRNDWRDVRAEDCNKLLDSITDGKVPLLNSSMSAISQRSDLGIQSNTSGYEPTMNELPQTLQQVDSDKLEDTFDRVDDGRFGDFIGLD